MKIKNKELTKKIILSAQNGYCHREYDNSEAGFEIWKINDMLILFKISSRDGKPMYGYGDIFHIGFINHALKRVEEWT